MTETNQVVPNDTQIDALVHDCPGEVPAEGKVVELVAAVQAAYSAYGWVEEKQFVRLFDEVARLASILEEGCDCSIQGPLDWRAEIECLRLSQCPPSPVPVSERLPGPEDCDAEGRCWVGYGEAIDEYDSKDQELNPSWELCKIHPQDEFWLPAHSLPIPSQP